MHLPGIESLPWELSLLSTNCGASIACSDGLDSSLVQLPIRCLRSLKPKSGYPRLGSGVLPNRAWLYQIDACYNIISSYLKPMVNHLADYIVSLFLLWPLRYKEWWWWYVYIHHDKQNGKVTWPSMEPVRQRMHPPTQWIMHAPTEWTSAWYCTFVLSYNRNFHVSSSLTNRTTLVIIKVGQADEDKRWKKRKRRYIWAFIKIPQWSFNMVFPISILK